MARELVTQRGNTRVVFGAGASARIADALDRMGVTRVLVVGTPGRRDDAERIGAALGARTASVLAIAREHVPKAVAEQAAAEAARVAADAVLAMGGGSAIGLAKAVALGGRAKVVAVPTTYSGSELTAVWGMTDGGVKRTGRDERVRAALVVYDPALTVALPRDVTIASAWNAMAHAVEALWSPDAGDETARAAEESIALFARALPRLVGDGARPGAAGRLDDLEAREDALFAAYLAGVAISGATMGLHHKICHVLGGRGMPHAATHAALLPFVVAFNRDAPAAAPAMAALGRALGHGDAGDALFALAARTSAPSSLRDLGLPRDAVGDVARDVVAARPANPRPIDEAALRELLVAAWAGRTEPHAGPGPG
jgi:maleylacetate reductase